MNRKLAVVALLALAAGAFFALGGHRYLTFDAVKAQQGAIQAYYATHPWQTAIGFFVIYIAVTGLSLPGAAVMTQNPIAVCHGCVA